MMTATVIAVVIQISMFPSRTEKLSYKECHNKSNNGTRTRCCQEFGGCCHILGRPGSAKPGSVASGRSGTASLMRVRCVQVCLGVA